MSRSENDCYSERHSRHTRLFCAVFEPFGCCGDDTQEILKTEIGVESFGHRRRIMKAIELLPPEVVIDLEAQARAEAELAQAAQVALPDDEEEEIL